MHFPFFHHSCGVRSEKLPRVSVSLLCKTGPAACLPTFPKWLESGFINGFPCPLPVQVRPQSLWQVITSISISLTLASSLLTQVA